MFKGKRVCLETWGTVGREDSTLTYPAHPQQCELSKLSWPRGEDQRWGGGTELDMTEKNGCGSSDGKQAGTALLGSKGNFVL